MHTYYVRSSSFFKTLMLIFVDLSEVQQFLLDANNFNYVFP